MGGSTSRITRRRLLLAAGGAAIGLGIEARFNRDWIRVERHTLRLPNWPGPSRRVAVLADFHADGPNEADRAVRAVRLAAAERPDVLVLPGDHVSHWHDQSARGLRRAVEALSDTGLPVVAVLGNHDYVAGIREVKAEFRRAGLRILQNEMADAAGIRFAAIDDGLFHRNQYGHVPKEFGSDPVVAVEHEPDKIVDLEGAVHLQISGHSHGGQICLPLGIPIKRPTGAKRYVTGFYRPPQAPLYVSRGIGTSGQPVRMFCPPEVSILTLTAA